MRQPPLAPDQQTAQLLLKALHGPRQRRLAHAATLRRPRKAERPAQRHKIPYLVQLHRTQVSRKCRPTRSAPEPKPFGQKLLGVYTGYFAGQCQEQGRAYGEKIGRRGVRPSDSWRISRPTRSPRQLQSDDEFFVEEVLQTRTWFW